jgi:ATP synthase F1 complex assembly factor 1
MLERGKNYPSFILPLPRAAPDSPDGSESSEKAKAHEFYFMQWATFDRPEDPRTVRNILSSRPVLSKDSIPPCPPSSAIMFTALAEYKLHQSYATPHLVLCNYTELAQSHGLILLRGDLTPSTSDPSRYRLNPADGQVLALSMQKFYVDSQNERGFKTLQRFHSHPDQFRWEDVVEICDFGATVA